jgi:hypothetical protein
VRSITIHGLEPELASRIEKRSHEQGTSLNKTIKMLLMEALGLSPKSRSRQDEFSDLFGIWSKEEAEEFNAAVGGFRTIDREDWR